MAKNDVEAFKVDNNYIVIKNKNNASILYDVNSTDFYKFNYSDDLPKHILDDIKGNDIIGAIKGKEDRIISIDTIPSEIFAKMELEAKKPPVFVNQSDKQRQLIDTKKKLENYYKIKVNKENTDEKYYFNYDTSKYELLDTFQLGILLETDFNITLSERDVSTIYGMFRKVTEPNNDAISFNNLVLDTRTFKPLPIDTFTIKKIPYNYIPINETKQDTLVERTLKEIFIPSNDANKDDMYLDFMQRIGASFKRVNKHKFIYMLQGKGNDGKGIILKILSLMYKDLVISIKPSNLTDDFFITNVSDTNLILIDELNKNSFNPQVVDLLKDISGRGVRDVRIMRSQKTIKAKDYGVIMIATNNIPSVPYDQVAYWKRLILIKLPNTFDETLTNNTEENMQNNILMANENLEFELEDDIDGIEWLISSSIEAYKNKGNNFAITQTATDTQILVESGNPINAFINLYVRKTNDVEDLLPNLEIKYHFLKWCLKRDVTLDVSNSQELSKEIGRIIANKFEYATSNKRKKDGVFMYPGLTLQLDEDKLSIDEIKEKIHYLEDAVIGLSDKI